MSAQPQLSRIKILGPMQPGFDEVLTPDALAFLDELHARFDARRR